MSITDIRKVLSDLVAFRSVTPNGLDAIEYCAKFLEDLGFQCEILQFGEVSNLYAKLGNYKKNICFAGHIDVVPPLDGWDSDPFELTEKDGKLFGRGTNDMKGPLSSAFVAIKEYLENNIPEFSISVILTSDEEIMGDDGTKRVVEHLKEIGELITACVLCESCSPELSGEYIKVGCRGSLNVDFISSGTQCHVVSGKKLGNHLHDFVKFLTEFSQTKLDDGSEYFSQSDIEMTSIDVGNTVRNIIPGHAVAKFNIRFNDLWTFDKLEDFIMSKTPKNINVKFERFGYPFVGASSKFIEFLKTSIKDSINVIPEVGTSGGNSDALFLKDLSDVVEIGSRIAGAHIVNESITIEELLKLKHIYLSFLDKFSIY